MLEILSYLLVMVATVLPVLLVLSLLNQLRARRRRIDQAWDAVAAAIQRRDHLTAILAEMTPNAQGESDSVAIRTELLAARDCLQHAGQTYNDQVRAYRQKQESFPTSLVAPFTAACPGEFPTDETTSRPAPAD